MKLNGIQKVEVDVDSKQIFDAFLLLLKQSLPREFRNEDFYLTDGEIFFTEEVIGHNRDYEEVRLKDRYPTLVITEHHMKIVQLYCTISNMREDILKDK